MRLKNIPGARERIAESQFVVQDPKAFKGKWNTKFDNQGEIHIEVGMGKGRFLMEMAKRNPTINYIGIEMYSSVLLRAVQKMEEESLENLTFILIDAREIEDIFEKEEISKIYLNFSDPWPKDRHAKRRLPSRQFLQRFSMVLKKEGVIEFKTDNRSLFDFAVEETEPAGWEILEISYDLHKEERMMKDNVMTEYEERFSSMGNPIFKYIIRKIYK
ncbi:MAG: tRNA (guanosine(46)-N7)-methyltransferase TrmB [Lachnospiraceae bacterium]|nr:tRNA (guanosine(46)-N7)-methyltransferase TrmB [Lachnospiraceae bacterium]